MRIRPPPKLVKAGELAGGKHGSTIHVQQDMGAVGYPVSHWNCYNSIVLWNTYFHCCSLCEIVTGKMPTAPSPACSMSLPWGRACLGDLVTLAAAGWQLALGMSSPHNVHSMEGKGTHNYPGFFPLLHSKSHLSAAGPGCCRGFGSELALTEFGGGSIFLLPQPALPLLCFLRLLGKAFAETEERRATLPP